MLKQLIILKWTGGTSRETGNAIVTKALRRVKGAVHTQFGHAVESNWYGDTACHLVFPDQTAWEASGIEDILDDLEKEAAVDELEAVAFPAKRFGISKPGLKNGVHRSLLFKVGQTTQDQEQRAIDDLAAMPDHVPEILNWGMNPVVRARGTDTWSHVWEQEYADNVAYVAYLNSDYHCYYVGNWWDPEIWGIMALTGRNHASTLSESVMAHYK